jgi:hypothetical protein
MSKNDDKIITLKKQIEQRREAIGKPIHFSPLTSCVIELDGMNYNINVLKRDELILLYCKLRALAMAADSLGIDQPIISGFQLNFWCADIGARIAAIDQKNDLAQLADMEKQLDKLLSNDKRTELEIDAIAAMLK